MICRPTLAVASAALAWAALANPSHAVDAPVWDPFETVNRTMFGFNVAVAGLMAPITEGYRSTVPTVLQTGVSNVFTNLREPLTAFSSSLQGDWANAGTSVGRFAVNSTAGMGGLLDVSTGLGLVSRPETIGTALCAYGVSSGPYIVLPFIGPSTVLDAAGQLVTLASAGMIVRDDWFPGYIAADRFVAFADDGVPPKATTDDPYVEYRMASARLSSAICEKKWPKEQIKASPLGRIAPREAPDPSL
jgi:phospholipid-binding lipoprotein MlaA